MGQMWRWQEKQECIPVGCILPARCCMGVSLTETLPGQRRPWTETHLDRDPPWTETPWTKTPPVDRQTPVKTLPSQTSFGGGNYS